jgi:hypothetical protein
MASLDIINIDLRGWVFRYHKISNLVKDHIGSRDRSVGIEMGYGMDDRASIPGKGKRFFSTP